MFGLFKRSEHRAGDIDIGAVYASLFRFSGSSYSWTLSPAAIAATLTTPDNLGALVLESRRLAEVTPLLVSYRRCLEAGMLTGEPEAPEFPEIVPERVATAAAALWTRHHDVDRERDLLHRLVVDGEVLLLDTGEVVPADGFEPQATGADWMRTVHGYKLGKSNAVRRAGLRYIGDRPMGRTRAMPWQGNALPYCAALASTRIAAGHGLQAMARITSAVENASPDRIAAGAGHRSGLVERQTGTETAAPPLESLGVGSVPYLRAGEKLSRIMAGPDKTAQDYEALIEADIAAALNLPLSELKSDYRSGSFSNLKMAWTDAGAEYRRRRLWWYRNVRLPLWRDLLSDAVADGALPRMSREVLEAVRMPTWPGPVRESPQPEKEMMGVAALVREGVLSPAAAAAKLEQ